MSFLLVFLAEGCFACKDPARSGSVSVVLGEEEKLRAAGDDAELQDSECRTLCAGFAASLAEVAQCSVEPLEGGGSLDTAGVGVGPVYLLTCEGTFYCV